MTPLDALSRRLLDALPDCEAWACARLGDGSLLHEAGPSQAALQALSWAAKRASALFVETEPLLSMLLDTSESAPEPKVSQALIRRAPHVVLVLSVGEARELALILVLKETVNVALAWATARATAPQLLHIASN